MTDFDPIETDDDAELLDHIWDRMNPNALPPVIAVSADRLRALLAEIEAGKRGASRDWIDAARRKIGTPR